MAIAIVVDGLVAGADGTARTRVATGAAVITTAIAMAMGVEYIVYA